LKRASRDGIPCIRRCPRRRWIRSRSDRRPSWSTCRTCSCWPSHSTPREYGPLWQRHTSSIRISHRQRQQLHLLATVYL